MPIISKRKAPDLLKRPFVFSPYRYTTKFTIVIVPTYRYMHILYFRHQTGCQNSSFSASHDARRVPQFPLDMSKKIVELFSQST